MAAATLPDSRIILQPSARLFLMVGLCGGYTTFSSFSIQTLDLLRAGQFLSAGANAVLSVLLCLAAVWLGHLLGQVFTR